MRIIRKTYGVDGTELSTLIRVGKETRRILFQGGVCSLGIKARFSTSDKALQEAIETDDRYGSSIVLDSTIETEDVAPVEKKGKETTFKSITRLQDARNILATKYGISLGRLNTKDDVRREAEKAKVSFPNMR